MTYQLYITRKTPSGTVTAAIDCIYSRRELTRCLADNIHTDKGTAHISIEVWGGIACRKLYAGTVEGLKGKRL